LQEGGLGLRKNGLKLKGSKKKNFLKGSERRGPLILYQIRKHLEDGTMKYVAKGNEVQRNTAILA